MTQSPAAPKRPYTIDPRTARERAAAAGVARHRPGVYIASLERADLSAEDKRRLAALVASFGADPGPDAEGGAA